MGIPERGSVNENLGWTPPGIQPYGHLRKGEWEANAEHRILLNRPLKFIKFYEIRITLRAIVHVESFFNLNKKCEDIVR